jgi:hypothetical protein
MVMESRPYIHTVYTNKTNNKITILTKQTIRLLKFIFVILAINLKGQFFVILFNPPISFILIADINLCFVSDETWKHIALIDDEHVPLEMNDTTGEVRASSQFYFVFFIRKSCQSYTYKV